VSRRLAAVATIFLPISCVAVTVFMLSRRGWNWCLTRPKVLICPSLCSSTSPS